MTTATRNPNETAQELLRHLRLAMQDRGRMADLRCAWNRARLHSAWPLLGPLGLIEDEAALAVAGGFAYHPSLAEGRSFGSSCQRLTHAGAEQRFQRLLSATRQEACRLIRPLILALRSKGIPVDYAQLYADLRFWSPAVRRRWAVDFWARRRQPAQSGAETEESPRPDVPAE